MEKLIAFSNRTEGRDKFTKAIQYGSKIISWAFMYNNRQYHKRFNELYILSRDSRKVFKLFKTIQETKTIIDKIKDLLWKEDKIPVVLDILSRLGFMLYWVFDNLVILNRFKLIHNENVSSFSYVSHLGWLIGILWQLLKNVYELIRILMNENYIVEDCFGNQTKHDRREEIKNHVINIVGNLGDLLPASSGVNLPERIFGYQFSDGLNGLGGLISAIVQIRELWNRC
jgi:peroxin-11B